MFVVNRIKKRAEFNRRFNGGFLSSMKEYNTRLDNSFAETRTWGEAFPETMQANGTLLPAGFDRPTKDMGDLMEARLSTFVSTTEMEVTYPINYSHDIFAGFTSVADNYIPARPLPQIVPNEVDWVRSFKEGWDAS